MELRRHAHQGEIDAIEDSYSCPFVSIRGSKKSDLRSSHSPAVVCRCPKSRIQNHKSKIRSAYTLIELLIVIAVLGISSAILVPNIVNRDWMNAQAAVRLIIGDLSFAQSDALAHQAIRRVHFYEDGRGYCLVKITPAQMALPFDESEEDHQYVRDVIGRHGSANFIVDFTQDRRFAGVRIVDVDLDGGGRDLQYDHLGGTIMAGGSSGIPGTGGTITVESNDHRYRITIAAFTGKLTVEEL